MRTWEYIKNYNTTKVDSHADSPGCHLYYNPQFAKVRDTTTYALAKNNEVWPGAGQNNVTLKHFHSAISMNVFNLHPSFVLKK